MFLVPYNKLSEEQKAIIRRVSRQSSDLFVEGPPGSGKTLISLYILKDMIENQSIRPLLVIFNHSLFGYLRSALKELDLTDNITIVTKDKYFWDLAKQKGVYIEGEIYDEKYNSILSGLKNQSFEQVYDIAVVDEVQDLSKEEWDLLNRMTKRITSLGDFDQGVYNTNLTKDEVCHKSTVEKLKDIFRFHRNIAKIAQKFSRSSERLEDKVSRIENKDVQLIDVNSRQETQTIADILKSLRGQRGRVGVLSHNHQRLRELHNALESIGIDTVYFQKNNDLRSHDFTQEIPLLVTSHSAKGLEFEHVILFGFDEDDSNISALRTRGQLQDLLYVSLTRTNSNLYLIRNSSTIKELRDISVGKPEPSISIDDIF